MGRYLPRCSVIRWSPLRISPAASRSCRPFWMVRLLYPVNATMRFWLGNAPLPCVSAWSASRSRMRSNAPLTISAGTWYMAHSNAFMLMIRHLPHRGTRHQAPFFRPR